MKNVLTGILIGVFLVAYSVTLNIGNFSFKKKVHVDICGLSIGSSPDFIYTGSQESTAVSSSISYISGSESNLNITDIGFVGDLIALDQETFSFGDFKSSNFISRENQYPKEWFIEPEFIPS